MSQRSRFGMVGVALGPLTPVQWALIQKTIDVAVILNALRALGGGKFVSRACARCRASALLPH
jgi:hypothetical protein